MVFSLSFLIVASFVAVHAADAPQPQRASDPCATIAGQKWVAPKDLRACFTSVKVDPVIKENV
jgi:hypothetical protein